MIKVFEKSRLYNLQKNDFIKVIHNEPIKAALLIILKMEIKLQPELIEMLDKMAGALPIDRSKLEYIVFNNPIDVSQVANSYEAKNILVFGAEPADLCLNMELKLYTNYKFSSMNLLLVNNILDVYSNQNLKGKLWNSLKEMVS